LNRRQVSVNVVAGGVAALTTLAIGFVLTPYLVETLGDEAYGYIGLSNNFITYAAIFTTALNSMAARFILMAQARGDTEKVNEYYSSLFYAGAILAGIFLLVGGFLTAHLQQIFNITPALLPAVRLTFLLTVLNYCVVTLFTVFSTSAFVANRLDLTARGSVTADAVKAGSLLLLFVLLKPQIYYVAIGALLYTLVLNTFHLINTRRLLPEVKIKTGLVRFSTIGTLVSSGVWNSSYFLISILMVGMDLMLANWLINGKVMGLLSTAATISTAMSSIRNAVTNAFRPSLATAYAEESLPGREKEGYGALKAATLRINRFQNLLLLVPIAGLTVFGGRFYALWMPYKPAGEIQLLAVVTGLKMLELFGGLTVDAILYNFTLYNSLKKQALAQILVSCLNIPIVVLLVKTVGNETLGAYIIAGVSSLLFVIYYWVIAPRLAARVTGERLRTYYRSIGQNAGLYCLLLGLFFLINRFISTPDWPSLLLWICISAGGGYLLMFLLGTSPGEKSSFLKRLSHRISG
jgi:O-antigen/teichoic acid export membrane protein